MDKMQIPNDFNFYSTENQQMQNGQLLNEEGILEEKRMEPFEKIKVEDFFLNI